MKLDNKLKFHTKIHKSYINSLQKLLFFNSNQSKYYSTIKKLIENYGEPKIYKSDGRYIKVKIDELNSSESLFVSIGPKLVGVVIYYRVSRETIIILHIAIDKFCTFNKLNGNFNILMKIFSKIKNIASNTKEVKNLEFYYRKKPLKIKVIK